MWDENITRIAGVDEAGRGPLAGPVIAAAVIFPKEISLKGINDSKKLSEKQREELFPKIFEKAFSVGVGTVDNIEIDSLNILNASLEAMKRAVENLSLRPQHLLIDGNRYRSHGIPFTTIVKGDAKCFSIAAASIIAKVTRDKLMKELDEQFPVYGFAQHKGYPTKKHVEAIQKFGTCEIHRKSFVVKGWK
ncbi:MAG: ribonuclease HII [Ignavibacteriales bacterium]|nr:ribonuclease HII [Ignavibacteriales bacterium]